MSEHRHLYNTAAWKRAREAQLRAHPLCRMHLELGQTVVATVVDHIAALQVRLMQTHHQG